MAPRNKRKAARPQDPAIPKRARNHRTKQDPWEKSREDDGALEVEAILRVEYRRGLPFYEVHWKGYSSETTETTLEPAENPGMSYLACSGLREVTRWTVCYVH